MASLWCCHTEDVYGEILPHKRQRVCLCLCVDVFMCGEGHNALVIGLQACGLAHD